MAKSLMHLRAIRYKAVVSLLVLIAVLIIYGLACNKVHGQSKPQQLHFTYTDSPPDFMTHTKPLTHKQISQIFNLPYPLPPFNPKRTAEEWSQCKHWAIPQSTDPDANNWYRAATSIHAIKLRTVEQQQQMLQLYEGAARRGHYNATKNLTILYMDSNLVLGARFKPAPQKARYWLEQAIRQHRWVGALEWVPHIMGSEGSGLSSGDYKLAYFQQAADMGVALAQFELSEKFQPSAQEEVLLVCAADQGFSPAAHEMGVIYEARDLHEKALHYYQIAVMNGSAAGEDAAYAMQTFPDREFGQVRRDAYRDLKEALGGAPGKRGNTFYRFPRLNKVLPLPPAEITEWKGIYAAMNEEDAAYYQNPPPAEFYLKQVEAAGLLIPLEYLTQPYYPKERESLF